MELKYVFPLYLATGIFLVGLIISLIRFRIRKKYGKGKKVAALELIKEEPYYKRKLVLYRILQFGIKVCCLGAIVFALILVARPYTQTITEKENYTRDIILCMDISYSVDELNMELVDTLIDTVDKLKGERFGIVIFNTSPVLLCPLTDDYEYIEEVLENIRDGIKYRFDGDVWSSDGWYLYDYITEGTLVGNENRGSSLMSDGLASTIYDFPEDEDDNGEERTKIVIFSTDNDMYGNPYVTMEQAGKMCADNNVIVYGIGTEYMYNDDKQEMKETVEATGGTFYLQEDSGTVEDIVKDIEKQGKNLVKGSKEVTTEEHPEAPFLALLVAASLMMVLSKISRN